MKIFKYNEKVQFPIEKLSVAMGNFDGLHLGHRSVIDLARPKKSSEKFGVLTFDPHPREFFFPDQKPFRLMAQTTKYMKLKTLGVDILLEVPFTKQLSVLDPNDFVNKVLHQYFHLDHVVIGADFKFGHQRKGDAKLLKSIGSSLGIKVTVASIIKNEMTEISSTAIRKALKNGFPERASKMLGEWYSVVGEVIEGDKRGRTLGYPTINLELDNLHLPKFGIYSAVVKILTGKHKGSYSAAVSIGERPTYGKQKPNLEAHILNFSDDIYGEEVSVSLICFQRPETKFSSSEKLIEQMQKDCIIAKQVTKKIGM